MSHPILHPRRHSSSSGSPRSNSCAARRLLALPDEPTATTSSLCSALSSLTGARNSRAGGLTPESPCRTSRPTTPGVRPRRSASSPVTSSICQETNVVENCSSAVHGVCRRRSSSARPAAEPAILDLAVPLLHARDALPLFPSLSLHPVSYISLFFHRYLEHPWHPCASAHA